MVSVSIVSRYGAGTLPPSGGNRKLAGEPLHGADEVLELLADIKSEPVVAWTRKCSEDAHSLGFNQDDLCELLRLAVNVGQFRGAEWCMQREGGPWAACDAYAVERREWVAHAHKKMRLEYYVKFAIAKSGNKVLLASCHLS